MICSKNPSGAYKISNGIIEGKIGIGIGKVEIRYV
jgi:hypothetical protein